MSPAPIAQSVSTEWVEALPLGTAVQLTTNYGRTVLALKTNAHPMAGNDIWQTTDGRTLSAFGISMANPVRLETVEAGA